ncbi:4Fe-4S ferredoxin iron-sulfur binding domain protein [gut metagenome]|uniref:4Fe-4S ferredoxin iron-sulfur binding domain protein n=1 Tax=gut metagenome TaxID=749906 RepID=J9GCC3_9ZZZZ
MPYQLKFHKEKCIGCYACHIACLDAHHDVEEIVPSFRGVQKEADSSGEFEKIICPGCIHCGKCATVCPFHVIRFDAEGKMEKCDGCIERIQEGREPACVRVCYPGALTWEKIDE